MSAAAEFVDEHHPVLMDAGYVARMIGRFWVECECSWISQSRATGAEALGDHQKHVDRAGGDGTLLPIGSPS